MFTSNPINNTHQYCQYIENISIYESTTIEIASCIIRPAGRWYRKGNHCSLGTGGENLGSEFGFVYPFLLELMMKIDKHGESKIQGIESNISNNLNMWWWIWIFCPRLTGESIISIVGFKWMAQIFRSETEATDGCGTQVVQGTSANGFSSRRIRHKGRKPVY